VLAATLDPDGRRVVLTEEVWRHIVHDHPQLRRRLRSVTAAVREPDRRLPGRSPGEEWFFIEGEGPSRWLKVVVHYDEGEGRIVTAFPRRSFP
jgi:hypothetical protein